jgi:hypothetical protein
MVTAAAATVAVTAIALLVITGRPGSVTDPLGAAVAQVSAGKSGLVLEAERRKVIQQTAATDAFSVTSTPKISTAPPVSVAAASGGSSSGLVPSGPAPNPASAQGIAYNLLASYGFSKSQWGCLDDLWQQESGWNYQAEKIGRAHV